MLIGQHIALHEPPVSFCTAAAAAPTTTVAAVAAVLIQPLLAAGCACRCSRCASAVANCLSCCIVTCTLHRPLASTNRLAAALPLNLLQREQHIGLIDTKCSPAGVCQDAIDDARSICMREKGSAPDVSVNGLCCLAGLIGTLCSQCRQQSCLHPSRLVPLQLLPAVHMAVPPPLTRNVASPHPFMLSCR